MTNALLLEPLDAWSFRDGKPFEAGETFEAQSVFPPFPWTVLGCLRTALLRRLCAHPERYAGRGGSVPCPRCGTGPCPAEAVVGPAGGEPPFSVGPPLLARLTGDHAVDVFYPLPRDVVAGASGTADAGRLLAPLETPPGVAHSLGRLRPVGALSTDRVAPFRREELRKVLSPDLLEWASSWMSFPELGAYLEGQPPGKAAVCPPMVYREPRIGVGIDWTTRSARRGQLYLRDVVRLEDGGGLLVRTSQPLDLEDEVGRLGGDGRMVKMCRVTVAEDPPAPRSVTGRLKVYLASPSWFVGGWRPSWIDEDTLAGVPPGADARVRLLGAAIGDPVAVGGWDLKHQRPRELRQLVGAGSVYFFEVERGDLEAVVRALHGRPVCDDPWMAKAGFGLAFVGRY